MAKSAKKFNYPVTWASGTGKGFTLIELMITVVIVAVGVALAVPTYERTMQKRELTNAAEGIAAFFALAQGEAIKRNETIAVTVKRNTAGDTWCLGAMIRTAATDHCDCDLNPVTQAGEPDFCDFDPAGAGAPQLFNSAGYRKFTMTSAMAGGTASNDIQFYFDPIRGIKVDNSGTIDPNTHRATLLSKNLKNSLRVELSVTGRIFVCNPDSTKKVPGFDVCSVIPAPPPPPAPIT